MTAPVGSNPTLPPVTGASTQPLTGEQIQQLATFFEANSVSFTGGNESTFDVNGVALLDVPVMSPDDAIALLMSLNAKLGQESQNAATEGVQANAEKQKAAREEQQKLLIEAAQEMEKAKEAGLIGQIFGWIGAAVAIIAAVAVTIATFGAAAPASGLAIAGVIAALTGAVLAGTTQVVTSIPGAMESMGKEGSQAFMFTMMALQIACAIVSIGAGAASAAGAGSTAAKGGTDAAKAATEIATKAGKIELAAEKLGKVAQITSGAVEMAEGGTSIAKAEYEHTAQYAQADVKELVKWLKALATQDEQAIEFVRALQEMQDQGWSTVIDVTKEANDLQQSLTSNFQGSPA
jgi:transloator